VIDRRPAGGLAVLTALLALSGCGLLFPGVPGDTSLAAPEPAPDPGTSDAIDDLPVGLGTLRQDEISMKLRRGELQVRVTPLDESIIRVTAPDTYDRLSALGRGHQEIFQQQTGSAVPFRLFLVSLYSESTEVTFEPEALNLVNRGLRYRPVEIRAVTPDWDSRLVTPRETVMAIYAFTSDLDLERDVEVEYQEVRSRDWQEILPVVQRERALLRSRSPRSDR
jgi:hypothetical protein